MLMLETCNKQQEIPMAQQSLTIDYVVDYILPNYSDEHLSNMLKQRPNKASILHQAVLKEMARRCAVEYKKQYNTFD